MDVNNHNDSGGNNNHCDCFCMPFVGSRGVGGPSPFQHVGIGDGRQQGNVVPDDEMVTQLAKEVSELSVKERDRVYDDIHGIPYVVEENPDFVNQCLQQMDNEVQKLLQSGHNDQLTYAYRLALLANPAYVQGRPLCLMMLRGCKYESIPSARRIMTHFRWKLDLFGPTKIGKEYITLDDLDEDDIIALEAASFFFLPGTDRAGRKVFMMNEKSAQAKTWKNQVRAPLEERAEAKNSKGVALGCQHPLRDYPTICSLF